MNEPSILDYLKSKLMPWRGIKVEIPPMPEPPPVPESGTEAGDLSGPSGTVAAEPVSPGASSASPGSSGIVEVVSQQSVEVSSAPLAAATTEKVAALPLVWPYRSLAALAVALAA